MSEALPRVFLHGWGLSGVVWQETLAQLPGQALDLPGYGGAAPLSPQGQPHDVAAVADALAQRIAQPSAVVGWSMGGMVALALAARHPDKVAKLVLVATTPAFVARDDWPHALTPEVLQGFAQSLQGDYRATLQRFLSLQARGGEAAREVTTRLRERLRAQIEPSAAVLAAGLELLRSVDLREEVARVSCPSLVVHGAHDTLCLPQAGVWLAEHLPNARLALHEHAAHAPFLSHPEWFVATLKTFLHG